MLNEERESLMRKLKALLEREARPSTLHEGINATNRINELLAKHNLTLAQLHAEGKDDDDVTEFYVYPADIGLTPAGKRAKWQESLAVWIATLLHCKCLFITPNDRKTYGHNAFMLIGSEANIAMSIALFVQLVRTAENGAASQEGKENKNAFRYGFARAIAERIDTIERERQEKEAAGDSNACMSLMIVKKDAVAIQALYAKHETKTMDNRAVTHEGSTAYHQGKQAGNKASLGTNQIGSSEVKLIR